MAGLGKYISQMAEDQRKKKKMKKKKKKDMRVPEMSKKAQMFVSKKS